MAVLVPHFDLPFAYSAGKPNVVEQDSLDDVANCVEAVVRTTQGQRLEISDFGIPAQTFATTPLDQATIVAQILQYEPRASVVLDQALDAYDALHTLANIGTSKAGT